MPRATSLFACVLLLLAAVAPSCAGTGGELVDLQLRVVPEVPEAGTLATRPSFGEPWRLELTEAWMNLGAVYVIAPPEDALTAFLRAPFAPSVARAHAGHDNQEGFRALAEVRRPMLLDLLDPTPMVIDEWVGEAGQAATISVWLEAPPSEDAAPTRGHHGFVAGTARRGEESLPFELSLDIPPGELQQRVDNIDVGGDGTLVDGGVVEVSVSVTRWLELLEVDLWLQEDAPSPSPEDEVYRPTQPSVLHTGWRLRAQSARTFEAWVMANGGNL
jgi:hypothetical protein